jgi:hypothetical protein
VAWAALGSVEEDMGVRRRTAARVVARWCGGPRGRGRCRAASSLGTVGRTVKNGRWRGGRGGREGSGQWRGWRRCFAGVEEQSGTGVQMRVK